MDLGNELDDILPVLTVSKVMRLQVWRTLERAGRTGSLFQILISSMY